MGYQFDGPGKLVILTPGTVAFAWGDMYSRWVDWLASAPANRAFLPAMRSVGGDAISEVKQLGVTYFLRHGWRVRPQEASHTLRAEGNVYTDPAGESPFVPTLGAYNVMIEMTVSSLVDSSLVQMPEIEYASYDDGVTIDTIYGTAGTAYPVGTQQSPVSNLADAIAIADARGFENLYLKGHLTVGSTQSVAGKHIWGQGATFNLTKSLATLIDGCTTTNAHWHHCRITGKQGGESNYHECIIDRISNAHCHYDHCGLLTPVAGATIEHSASASASHVADFHQCYSDSGEAIIDRNGSAISQVFAGYTGNIKFINQTADSRVAINMAGGRVTIDASCTAGTFVVSGVGEVVDQSNGALVDISQLSGAAATWQHPDALTSLKYIAYR